MFGGGGGMIIKDHKDSPPCFLPGRQIVTFIFSQPRNSIPSYLTELFSKKGSAFDSEKLRSIPVKQNTQMHQVDISIGSNCLWFDVPIPKIDNFLRNGSIRKYASTSFFLSPDKLNMLLDRATGNFLEDGGRAQCLDSGLLFARGLKAGEIVYVIDMSRTPTKMIDVDLKLGRT